MSRNVCAVDFTTNVLQVLLRKKSGEIASNEALLPTEAIEDGKLMQPTAVQFYLVRLLAEMGVKGKNCEVRVCLSDSACVTRVLDFPAMPDKDLEKSLRIESGRELPLSPESAYLAWQVVGEEDGRRKVLLTAAWRDVVEDYLKAVSGIGFVSVVEPRAFALARTVGKPNSLLCEWANDRVQVAQVQDARIAYTASVPLQNGMGESPQRVARLVSGLLPRIRRSSEPTEMVLLGKLQGREDITSEMQTQLAAGKLSATVDWSPPKPYEQLSATGQLANVGILMRN
ncbi:MAG TPA: pilus assembly protein PilM [Candidatus Dormibacteraeota bacterium]|nr:pilus assembly protein PilM [Candidatus Dormibacteraeota bacterium]